MSAESLAEDIDGLVDRFRQEMTLIRAHAESQGEGRERDLASLSHEVAQYTTTAHQALEAETRFYRDVTGVVEARARLMKQHRQKEQSHEREREPTHALGY